MRALFLSLFSLVACYDGGDYNDAGFTTYGWQESEPLDLSSATLRERSSIAVTPSGEVATESRARRQMATGAYIGMSGMVCQVNWASATIQADYDPDSRETEEITDFDGDTVLSITSDSFQILNPYTGETTQVGRPGILDARIGRGAHILVLQDPAGCVVELGPRHKIPVPGTCGTGDAFTADPDSMTAWTAGPAGVVEVDRDGARPTGIPGDLLARDADNNVLYVSQRGASEVRAYNDDRTPRWTAPVDGAVRQLRAVSARDMVAVLVDRDEGSAILYIDAVTGAVTEAGAIGTKVNQLSVSPDGTRLALVAGALTHFVDDRSIGDLEE